MARKFRELYDRMPAELRARVEAEVARTATSVTRRARVPQRATALLTPIEAARTLGIARATTYEWAAQRRIESVLRAIRMGKGR